MNDDDHSEHISHHLVSAISVLRLTVDCLVESLAEHTVGDERQAMTVDLYWQLAQWCDEKADRSLKKDLVQMSDGALISGLKDLRGVAAALEAELVQRADTASRV